MKAHEAVAILRLWQRRLGLERWRIDAVTDLAGWEAGGGSEDDSRSAFVNVPPDYDEAVVHLHPAKLASWDTRKGTAIVVHELLHLVVRGLEEAPDALERQVHRDVWAVFCKVREHELEALVDGLAWRLVELEADLQPRRAERRSPGSGRRKAAPTGRRP